MSIRPPSTTQLEAIATQYDLQLSADEIGLFEKLIGDTLASYERLESLAEPKLPVCCARTPGYRPSSSENPLNAWYWRCSISKAVDGSLRGKSVAVKDNVAVAGVPMMNGCSLLEGHVPDSDATVVTRILEAGGEIAGKSVCEHLCFSGGSHTSDTGPVLNPHDPARNAGGSSSGSAALVAAGACAMAIGGDQGGSIRVPSSYCGVYGLKPTHGLVPYTGAAPIERTLDHLGPMAGTVEDVALLLRVIAGGDGLDPRQATVPDQHPDYVGELEAGVNGFRIGFVSEGFDWAQSEMDVDAAVRGAAKILEDAGAKASTISIPIHRDGLHIWTGIAVEGAFSTVVRGNSGGTNAAGYFDTPLIDAFGRSKSRNGASLSVTVKLTTLLGEYLQSVYGGRYYGKARNLSRTLIEAYDEALRSVDILAMPTTPRKATRLPAPDASWNDIIDRAWECEVNTRPFDVSGHPAMTVPLGVSDGLPIGLMLIGRHWDESSLLRAAKIIQSAVPRVEPPGMAETTQETRS